MVTLAEASATAQTPLADALAAGVATISYDATVTFTKYIRVVLPADGFVFWVNAEALSESALFNFAGIGSRPGYNSAPINQNTTPFTPSQTQTVSGSLHYISEKIQEEASSYTKTRVIFTTNVEIEDLSEVAPTVMYIGEIDGTRFAFGQHAARYDQANLWHYTGDAIYSTLDTQIIDDPATFDTLRPVVSDSLPIWLSLNQFSSVYPAELVPNNLPPPYMAVNIVETRPLQPLPAQDQNSNQLQLMRDRVRVTTYGWRNYTAQDWLAYMMDQSTFTDNFGLLSEVGWVDEKEGQVELNALAQKKTLVFDVSYYQSRVRDVARKLILSASCAITTTPGLN